MYFFTILFQIGQKIFDKNGYTLSHLPDSAPAVGGCAGRAAGGVGVRADVPGRGHRRAGVAGGRSVGHRVLLLRGRRLPASGERTHPPLE